MSHTATPLAPSALSGRQIAPARGGIVARVLDLVALRRQRRALADLDAALLKDIGVSPDEARLEAARRLWDVPQGWRT
ncbi:DUF1127 domain-containing protein [Vannielia litorea]|uniref:YjiS-like domain-containing protein n=1 Tax=Vannielia litorea TaxID=1217970 RepID=A0A1N6EFW4_9RHOB|nr:DUF1127 domain-containing protein [Vannielia litorea]SIN81922.1 protein of unknown function [Vannielia litorea]